MNPQILEPLKGSSALGEAEVKLSDFGARFHSVSARFKGVFTGARDSSCLIEAPKGLKRSEECVIGERRNGKPKSVGPTKRPNEKKNADTQSKLKAPTLHKPNRTHGVKE